MPASVTLAEARRGIEEGYRRNRAALLAKDMIAVMALRTDDFHAIGPDGKRLDRAAMEQYTSGFLNGIERWILLSFEIESLTLDGLEADAITRQHAVRMALRSDSKVHHVETWVTQRERWRLTPDGWKLAQVDEIRDQRRLVDGQAG
jgi:ketosteroid isomerase-like protein